MIRAEPSAGNASWTRNACQECGNDVEAVVILGQEDDPECWLTVCEKCLLSAVSAIEPPAAP